MFLFMFIKISASFLLYLFSQEEDEIEDFDMCNICPNEEYV